MKSSFNENRVFIETRFSKNRVSKQGYFAKQFQNMNILLHLLGERANVHFAPTSSGDIHIPTFSSWTDSQAQLLSHVVAQRGMKILIWRLNGIPSYELLCYSTIYQGKQRIHYVGLLAKESCPLFLAPFYTFFFLKCVLTSSCFCVRAPSCIDLKRAYLFAPLFVFCLA